MSFTAKLLEQEETLGREAHEVYQFTGITGPEPAEPTKEFIYEGLDRPIAMFTDADNNLSTGTLGGREAYFYHCNPRGDVYALSDESGVIIERYDYSLFGDTSVMDASFQLTDEEGNAVTTWQESKSSYGNPFQFGGAYQDDETGFMQMRFRYYDSQMRGFISRDPIEDDSLGNLYAAFENAPGTYIDPLGLGKGGGRRYGSGGGGGGSPPPPPRPPPPGEPFNPFDYVESLFLGGYEGFDFYSFSETPEIDQRGGEVSPPEPPLPEAMKDQKQDPPVKTPKGSDVVGQTESPGGKPGRSSGRVISDRTPTTVYDYTAPKPVLFNADGLPTGVSMLSVVEKANSKPKTFGSVEERRAFERRIEARLTPEQKLWVQVNVYASTPTNFRVNLLKSFF